MRQRDREREREREKERERETQRGYEVHKNRGEGVRGRQKMAQLIDCDSIRLD